MNDLSDSELLREYVLQHSEQAFAALVSRYVDLVYSVAVRMLYQREAAEDVTQKTFVALAQSARKLIERAVLSGWLHKTATHLAAESIRSDIRRRKRETEAPIMWDNENPDTELIWSEIAKHLDEAITRLGNDERDALCLRYFEGKSAREIAQRLGASEEAVQKRINRAVHRLRAQLMRRGLTASVATLGLCLSSKALEAAPASLALAVSKTALAAPASAFALSPSALKTLFMTTTQKKLVGMAVLALCLGGGASVAVKRFATPPTEREAAAAAVDLPLDKYTGRFRYQEHELIISKKGKGLSIGSAGSGVPFVAYPSSATEFVSHDQGSLTRLSFTLDQTSRASGFKLVRDGRLLGDLQRAD